MLAEVNQPKAFDDRLENPVAVVNGSDAGNRAAVNADTILHDGFNVVRVDGQVFQPPIQVGKKQLGGVSFSELFLDADHLPVVHAVSFP